MGSLSQSGHQIQKVVGYSHDSSATSTPVQPAGSHWYRSQFATGIGDIDDYLFLQKHALCLLATETLVSGGEATV